MTPFERLLNDLLSKKTMPPQADLYHLSNLENTEVLDVQRTWVELPTDLRYQLAVRLVEMAEADFELDFGEVFRICLEDEDASVRAVAIEGLWEDEDVLLVPRLVQLLQQDDSAIVRAAAAESLGRYILLGELNKMRSDHHLVAYDAVLAAHQDRDEDPTVQRRALESLAYVENETVIRLIQAAYNAADEKMRVSAVFAMGRSADSRWASLVQQELFSGNPELRFEAARACGELQLRESVPELAGLVEDVDAEVQEAALWALGQIGGDQARQILQRYIHHDNEAIQAAAEAALNELEFMYGDLDDFFIRLAESADD
ncbi:MAG TPA: HEAT repeat domain-containing protein [Chloroflexi bacterium]|nr:HEAT repeat domain-containing protein [Chloroflexota bacterium]